jgi:hypothetical protein
MESQNAREDIGRLGCHTANPTRAGAVSLGGS